MSLFDRIKQLSRRKKPDLQLPVPVAAQAVRQSSRLFGTEPAAVSLSELRLYRTLRNSIPIIDAAIDKIIRLVGTFSVSFENEETTLAFGDFLNDLSCSPGRGGIHDFLSSYLGQLITYGTAVGEIVLCGSDIYSLVNVPLEDVRLDFAENKIDTLVFPADSFYSGQAFPYQELFVVSALNPEPGQVMGVSILRGLEFVSDILMKIYNTIGGKEGREKGEELCKYQHGETG